ncbi:Rap1a/Tai family immunity protein [Pseudomonas fluorescens]|uniref:Rap1a immunity protein domain-containing protein n=1 Tax=Pseudomonas fluorescens TaxID=294 RepID=A0A5E7BY04_PSEFL|nr:Rap1a/Tai family immunity protein [Pseudomonas fluorescens]VVN89191.1 hypothetical protein PS710_01741 [Pseudomonas fluorescens]
MNKRAWQVLALSACCWSVSALSDGNKLLQECQDGINAMDGGTAKNAVGVGHCVGVLQATMDTLDLSHELTKLPKYVCMPEGGIPMIQSMRIVVKYLKANPESLNVNESILVTTALMSAFPCSDS